MARLHILPGSIVLNQDPNHPMSGEVISAYEAGYDPSEQGVGEVYVRWVNGTIELEVLAGQLNAELL